MKNIGRLCGIMGIFFSVWASWGMQHTSQAMTEDRALEKRRHSQGVTGVLVKPGRKSANFMVLHKPQPQHAKDRDALYSMHNDSFSSPLVPARSGQKEETISFGTQDGRIVNGIVRPSLNSLNAEDIEVSSIVPDDSGYDIDFYDIDEYSDYAQEENHEVSAHDGKQALHGHQRDSIHRVDIERGGHGQNLNGLDERAPLLPLALKEPSDDIYIYEDASYECGSDVATASSVSSWGAHFWRRVWNGIKKLCCCRKKPAPSAAAQLFS